MKNNILSLVFVGLFISSWASAQEDMWRQGTGRYRLDRDRAEKLLTYTQKAKRRIRRVFEDIEGKSRFERAKLLTDAIYDIVPISYEKRYGSETLMRMVINKALELTVGIPGGGKGVLDRTGNPDVIPAILERSLRIAYEYADEDIAALQSNDLSRLVSKYLPLGKQYIEVAQNEFVPGIMNAVQEHDFYHSVFSFFLLLFDQPDNLMAEPIYGDIVSQLNSDLDRPDFNLGWRAKDAHNDDQVIRVVRNLRGMMKKLSDRTAGRYLGAVKAQEEGQEKSVIK